MLSTFAKVLLVASSLAPILITWAFADYINTGPRDSQLQAIIVAAGLGVLCWLVLVAARRQLTRISFGVESVKTADAEVMGFVIAYLLPLVTTTTDAIDERVLVFVLVIVGAVVFTTHAYHFNPLLNLFGYHFYEVTTKGSVTFLLLTRRDLRSTRVIEEVVQLTDYMVLDLGR